MERESAAVKPLYQVPSMAEVRAIPWNGFRVVSTFSGCGGSSLGYRMAGFRVVYANEFVAAARDTYRANFPDTRVDGRDIREVLPFQLCGRTGIACGELDVLDGSPPCSSFSMSGKRERDWGEQKAYSGKTQRTDDLFFEFVRLVTGLQPRVFVAENVAGLVRGTAKGYFLEILAALKAAGYAVACRLLDAQWLGVPQARQRTFFVGVRNDLGIEPAFPEPLPYRYSVRDACPWISPAGGAPLVRDPAELSGDIGRFAIGKEWEKLRSGESSKRYFNLVRVNPLKPCPTVLASHGQPGIAGITHPTERRKFNIPELRRICSFPDDFVLTGTYIERWERLGRAVPPLMMFRLAEVVRDKILGRMAQ